MIAILLAALALLLQDHAHEVDETPSDAAALGFLRDYVDARVYNLPDLGARRWQGTASARVSGVAPTMTYQFDYDLEQGALSVTLKGSPPQDVTSRVLFQVTGLISQTLTLYHRPSFRADRYVLRLSREGEIVVVNFAPRKKDPALTASTWWYEPDGTPLREAARGGPQQALVVTSPRYEEQKGRMVLRAASIDDGTEYSYEYGEADGYPVLTRVEYVGGSTSVTVDFTSHLEPPREP